MKKTDLINQLEEDSFRWAELLAECNDRIIELEDCLRQIAGHPYRAASNIPRDRAPWDNAADNENFFHGMSVGYRDAAAIANKGLTGKTITQNEITE